ncbi:MAG: cellulase family glycosylhydrolase [Myxococcales bacterium]
MPRPIVCAFARAVVVSWAAMLALLSACDNANNTPTPEEPVEDGAYFIRDDDGRVLILRGMNIMSSSKGDPERLPDLTETDVERYAGQWGFNVVRYLIFWDAVEPSPDQYDTDYFDKTEERLDWFAANGVHVILDMHQDVYAQRFCCDGAPEWAIEDDGLPFEQAPVWSLNYFAPAVMAAFDNFFDYEGDYPYLQDHFAGAWTAVVERFKDHPAVLGYDILNEPSPGSAYTASDIRNTPPDGAAAEFDRTMFTDFYVRMIEAIRAVDPDGWIFYEPRVAAPANGQPSFIELLDDPREGEPRLVYAPHLYSIQFEFNEEYTPETDVVLENWEANRTLETQAQKAPLLLGEWGFDPTWPGADLFMQELLDMADRMMLNWTYWSYDPGGWGIWERNDDGEVVERDNANAIIRPYPQRVAGIPRSFGYDPDTRVFELVFDPSPSALVPTEVYVPAARHYPNGWILQGCDESEGCTWTWDAEAEMLQIATPGRSARVELRLAPNP